MPGLGTLGTKVDDTVVIHLLIRNPLAVLSSIIAITIAQKPNSPFLQWDKEIDPTALGTKFGEG